MLATTSIEDRYFIPLAVQEALENALTKYPGVGPALRTIHRNLPTNKLMLDRLEWAGDRYLTRLLFLVLRERPRYGNNVDFITMARGILTRNATMAAMMQKSGLGFPGISHPNKKELADGLEVMIAVYRQCHTDGQSREMVRDTFVPLIVALEDAYQPRPSIGKRSRRLEEPPEHPPLKRERIDFQNSKSGELESRGAEDTEAESTKHPGALALSSGTSELSTRGAARRDSNDETEDVFQSQIDQKCSVSEPSDDAFFPSSNCAPKLWRKKFVTSALSSCARTSGCPSCLNVFINVQAGRSCVKST